MNLIIEDYKTIKGDTYTGSTIQLGEDITGATILMQIKKTHQSQPLITLTEIDGITVTSPSTGVITINPFLVDLPASKYVYDIQVTFADGSVKTFQKGIFEVVQDTSRMLMDSLLTYDEFSTFRNISVKVDKSKVNECIKLAEQVDLYDVLGEFFYDLIENLNNPDYANLINGSSFEINGMKYKQDGLKSYLSDLVFVRFLYVSNSNFTPFGMVQKFTVDSQPVDRNFIRDMVKQNQQDASIKFKMIDKFLKTKSILFKRYRGNNNPDINTFGQRITIF